MATLKHGPVNTSYLRQLASDYRDSGREATAEDFEDAAATIDALQGALQSMIMSGVVKLPSLMRRRCLDALDMVDR
jgi:hypothetical protein